MMTPLYKLVISPPPSYGPPVIAKFYPTLGATGIAADGSATRLKPLQTWNDIHDGAGTHADDVGTRPYVYVTSDSNIDTWRMIRRLFFHFDTTAIPLGSLITEAEVGLYLVSKSNTIGGTPSCALVQSNDPTPDSIIASDYQEIGAAPVAPVKAWAEMVVATVLVFTIDAPYLSLVIPGGVSKFGIREYTYDCLNVAPPWSASKAITFSFFTIDSLGPLPYLEVTYRPPL